MFVRMFVLLSQYKYPHLLLCVLRIFVVANYVKEIQSQIKSPMYGSTFSVFDWNQNLKGNPGVQLN